MDTQTGSTLVQDLIQKFETKTATVGVIGLGYVGLPLAVEKAKVGFTVVGIDMSLRRVDQINNGVNYIDDVADEDLAELVRLGMLSATTSYDQVKDMDAIIICVPTPLTPNDTPDMKYIESVTKQLGPHLRRGQLVSLESTTYPGTTERFMLPILQNASELMVEEDFFLVHSPERINPGDRKFKTTNTIKVVGGVGPKSLAVAMSLYGQTIEKLVPVSSATAAELVKLWENTFRAVNCAAVNDLARLCHAMKLNVWEVLEAAATKPFGYLAFFPGPGVGGHCIPLDPYYLAFAASEYGVHIPVIGDSGDTNRRVMPRFVVRDLIYPALNQLGIAPRLSKVLAVGVAYKKDVGDPRESPALTVMEMLSKDGVNIEYHDPHVPYLKPGHGFGAELHSRPLNADTLDWADVVVILTDHTSLDYDLILQYSKKIVDTRNAFGFRGIRDQKVVPL